MGKKSKRIKPVVVPGHRLMYTDRKWGKTGAYAGKIVKYTCECSYSPDIEYENVGDARKGHEGHAAIYL